MHEIVIDPFNKSNIFSFLQWTSNWAVKILLKTSDFNDTVNNGKANILHLLKGPTGLYYDVKVGFLCCWLSVYSFSGCVAKATESTETT